MRIVFLTNIPAPYRTALYDALHDECAGRGDRLRVLYCAVTEPRRHWPYEPASMRHAHAVMPGVHPRIGAFFTHLNPVVWRELCVTSPDVLVVSGAWNTPTMLIAIVWAKLHGARLLFWSEGHQGAVLNPRGPISWLRRLVYGCFEGFLAPNARSAEWARAQGGRSKPVMAFPNSIDTRSFSPPPAGDKAAWRAKLGLPADAVVLTQVARLDAIKAPLELARAFLSLPEDIRGRAVLVFIGSGELQDDMGRLAARSGGRIFLAGNIAASAVREWLWASDVFVLNTRRDPNPLSPIEASAAELPVMMSGFAGNVDELVDPGVTGWVIRDPDNPARELEHAIGLGRLRLAEMGRRARAASVDQFDARNVARRFLQELRHAGAPAGQS